MRFGIAKSVNKFTFVSALTFHYLCSMTTRRGVCRGQFQYWDSDFA